MNGAGTGIRKLALALMVGLGTMMVAILFVLLWPPGSPEGNGATGSPRAVAGGSPTPADTVGPEPTATVDASPSVPATASPAVTPTAPPATAAPASPTTAPSTPAASPTTAPPTGWVEITDFPTYRGSTSVESITAGGPGYVAVGTGGRQLRGRVWTSSDGLRWTAQPDDVFGGYSLREVVRLGETLYAFGRGVDGLRVWRSADGRDWTSLGDPAELELAGFNDVVAVGQSMLAVGFVEDPETGEFGGAVWRSTDGVDWQRLAAPGGQVELWAVDAQGSTVVGINRFAPFSGGAPVYYSTDLGDSWQPATTDHEFGEDGGGLVSVAANDRRFVSVGYADSIEYPPIAMTSGDGRSWASPSRPGFELRDNLLGQVVALRGGRFLAIEGTDHSPQALVSSDGRGWSEVPPLYTGQAPRPPEGGDEVVTRRAVAASRAGVVVAQEWGDGVRIWFGPRELFE